MVKEYYLIDEMNSHPLILNGDDFLIEQLIKTNSLQLIAEG